MTIELLTDLLGTVERIPRRLCGLGHRLPHDSDRLLGLGPLLRIVYHIDRVARADVAVNPLLLRKRMHSFDVGQLQLGNLNRSRRTKLRRVCQERSV